MSIHLLSRVTGETLINNAASVSRKSGGEADIKILMWESQTAQYIVARRSSSAALLFDLYNLGSG